MDASNTDAVAAGQDEVRRTTLKRKNRKVGGVTKKRRLGPVLDWGDGRVDVEIDDKTNE